MNIFHTFKPSSLNYHRSSNSIFSIYHVNIFFWSFLTIFQNLTRFSHTKDKNGLLSRLFFLLFFYDNINIKKANFYARLDTAQVFSRIKHIQWASFAEAHFSTCFECVVALEKMLSERVFTGLRLMLMYCFLPDDRNRDFFTLTEKDLPRQVFFSSIV